MFSLRGQTPLAGSAVRKRRVEFWVHHLKALILQKRTGNDLPPDQSTKIKTNPTTAVHVLPQNKGHCL